MQCGTFHLHRLRIDESCMSDVEKFGHTLLDYFAMLLLLLCLMVKMVELKELCFVVQMESSFI